MEELRPQVIARRLEAAGHQLERDLKAPVLTVCKVQHPFNALIAGILDPASVPVDGEQDLDLARKQTPLRIGGRGGEACLVSGGVQPQRLLMDRLSRKIWNPSTCASKLSCSQTRNAKS